MSEKIRKVMNHKEFNMWFLSITSAMICLCGALETPAFTKTIYTHITQRMVSIQCFISCCASIIICLIWEHSKRAKHFVISHYVVLIIVSTIFSLIVDSSTIINIDKDWSIYLLVIGNMIVFDVLFGEWFNRSYSFVRASLFEKTKKRNRYDTISDLCQSISSMIGFGIGIFFDIPIKFALVLSIIGGLIWAAKHIVIFALNKEKIIGKMNDPESD